MINNSFGIPIIPANEEDRIKALYHYQIVDADVKDSFDNIAKIMAETFETPIALVSLVDREEVIFKGNVGMQGVLKTHRGISLCALAVMSDDLTVFENAPEVPCLMANPLVAGEFGLKFYAAAPLVTQDGYPIGTVCIVDKQPRTFSAKHRRQLKRFSSTVMNEIELRLDANKAAVAYTKTIEKQRNDLQQQNAKLLQVNAELSSFNFIANHDLKEPLRKIQMFSDKLQAETDGQLSEKGSLYIGRIAQSARHLQSMLGAILSYSKVANATELDLQPVDLNEVIENLRENYSGLLDTEQLILTVAQLPTIQGFAPQIEQIFVQLIENAIKYAKPNMPAQVQIKATQIAGETEGLSAELVWAITVEDNGIGFKATHNEKVFEIFKRLHHKSDYEGMGMGLAICKKIMQLHGGDMVASGTPDEGARFTLYFPAIK